MTKEEWRRFCRWFGRHEGLITAYCFWAAGIGWIPGVAVLTETHAGPLAVFLTFFVCYAFPLIGLALNAAVLGIRTRTNKNLRLAKRLAEVEARERRIAELERAL